jgi:hypothetical protein
MKSKVLNRKMFSAMRHDAHGVGITSGLSKRPSYARGGRVHYQFGGIKPMDIAGISEVAEQYYPSGDIETFMEEQKGLRDKYVDPRSKQQDYFDLARFFFNLPGPGTLTENVARASQEPLAAFGARKAEERAYDRARQQEDIDTFKMLEIQKEKEKGQFASEMLEEILKQKAEPGSTEFEIKVDATKKSLMGSDKFKKEVAEKFNMKLDELDPSKLEEEAMLKATTMGAGTQTAYNVLSSYYGFGVRPDYLGEAQEMISDLVSADKDSLQPFTSHLIRGLLSTYDKLTAEGIDEETIEMVLGSIPIRLNETRYLRKPESPFGASEILELQQETTEALLARIEENLVWVRGNLKPGMKIILPNGIGFTFNGITEDDQLDITLIE